jgi:hypothetical protein
VEVVFSNGWKTSFAERCRRGLRLRLSGTTLNFQRAESEQIQTEIINL